MTRSSALLLALVGVACGSSSPPPAGSDASVLADAGLNIADAGDFAGPGFLPALVEATSATYVDLALSGDGTPWIAYRANRVPTLAHREGSAWRIEAVSQLDGEDLDVERGAQGRPIVSFLVGANLHVATFDGTRWSDEDAGLTGVGADLEVDSDGSLHAVAGNRYLRRLAGAWTTESLATLAVGTALTIVGTATVAVSYYDPSARELRFARRVAADQWSAEVLQAYAFGAASIDSTAVAIGPDGTPFVAWCDDTDLKLARRGAGGWQSENVTRCGRGRTRLAVDGQGRVHLAHGGTIYGLRETAGTWTLTPLGVESFRSTSGFTGLSVDGRGNPHLVFTETTRQLVYYLAPRG